VKKADMIAASDIPSVTGHGILSRGILVRFGQVAFVFIIQALVLFLTANQFNWLWAWVFLGICVASVSINSFFILRTHPETIAERGQPKETKDWDKLVGGLWSLCIFLAVPFVGGLDVRFGWTPAHNPVYNIAGGVMLTSGLGLGGWAMISNAYFSTAVRIQSDRGHTVCRSGPYRFVRHPGYAGFVLQSLGTPILLGSFWAVIPGILAAALMVLRTLLEDRMLQSELTGYREFVDEVRYRLVPGIW
jgi:protein-S-isoprenylcysteine O-methyltransferase Ste14